MSTTYSNCSDCGCPGGVPQQYQLMLAGIKNGACISCVSLNGTFILNRSTGPVGCQWSLVTPGYCTLGTFFFTIAQADDGNLSADLKMLNGTDPSKPEWYIEGFKDCITGIPALTYVGTNPNSGCDLSASVAQLLAVAPAAGFDPQQWACNPPNTGGCVANLGSGPVTYPGAPPWCICIGGNFGCSGVVACTYQPTQMLINYCIPTDPGCDVQTTGPPPGAGSPGSGGGCTGGVCLGPPTSSSAVGSNSADASYGGQRLSGGSVIVVPSMPVPSRPVPMPPPPGKSRGASVVCLDVPCLSRSTCCSSARQAAGAAPTDASSPSSGVNVSNGNLVLFSRLPRGGSFSPVANLTYNAALIQSSEFGSGWTGLFNQKVVTIDASNVKV
ncbi:MAG TPA: hypothetical protein VKU82_16470, partial [Planctomycetaceae bacterium]|nr:hypothetical protein [Planctomycetaceae bacterium]